MGKKIEKVRKSRKKGTKSGCACPHTREPPRGHEVTSLPVRGNNTGKKYGEKNENEKNNGNLKKLNKNKLKKIEKNEEKKLKKVRKTSAENPKKRQETRLRMRTHQGTLSGSRGHVTSVMIPHKY
jgi:hypothetical protein